MNEQGKEEQEIAPALEEPSAVLAVRFFDAVTSMKFAFAVVFVIAIACIIGTVLPQGSDVADYLREHPEAVHRMERLTALGLTQIFHSRWFIGLLCVLSLNLAVCVTRRLIALRNSAGRERVRMAGTILAHFSILLILAGALIRGIWGTSGTIQFKEGQTRTAFTMEDGKTWDLPFELSLVDFEIERYARADMAKDATREMLVIHWREKHLEAAFPVQVDAVQTVVPEGEAAGPGNSFQVRILRRVPDFVLDTSTKKVRSRTDELKNPAILVKVTGQDCDAEQWLFAMHPDFDGDMPGGHAGKKAPFNMIYEILGMAAETGRIKDFKSTLKIVENGAVVREKTIRVNDPLSYKGYAFYQSGYDAQDETWTSLKVTRDPGVPVVYAGFILLTVGLLITTYSRTAPPSLSSGESSEKT